jgi:hypothetical protein
MPDRPVSLRTAGASVAVVLALAAALVAPAIALAVPLPGESCPAVAPGTSTSVVCGEGQPGSGGGDSNGGSLNLVGLLPIIGAALGGAAIALAAAFLVLRRRASGPVAPADPTEWWTCRKCGSNNVIGSPRCYSCGAWQG